MGRKMTFSIVIPFYSNKSVLSNLLDSIERTGCSGTEVIVVCDGNEEPDYHGSAIDLCIIKNEKNLGYGLSANKGAASARNEWICISNSDIVLPADFFPALRREISRNPYADVLQPALYDAGSVFDPFSKRRLPRKYDFLLMPFYYYMSHYGGLFYGTKYSEPIECGKGAFIVIKRSVFLEAGGFSSDYRMFWEDVDLFAKLRAHGHRAVFLKRPSVTHLGGATVNAMRIRSNMDELASRAKYFEKWHRVPRRAVYLAEIAGSILKFIFSLLLFKRSSFIFYPVFISKALKATFGRP